ncbi:MAG: hypothetical protein KDK10_13965 [Maritimibacter sp.]|nr:hypothetical protein [Maritimibacter sp.]
MFWPISLLFLSLAGLGAALTLPGWSDLVMIAGPSAFASLYLLLRALRGPSGTAVPVVVDGSNVMYWRDGTPQFETLIEVLARIRAEGMQPGVVFDANAGHLLFGRYMGDRDFARRLKLPQNRVLVVANGTPADPTILGAARDMGARIVTNDRFRDWAEAFPEVTTPGHLIPGRFEAGKLRLDTAPPPARKTKRRPEGRRRASS